MSSTIADKRPGGTRRPDRSGSQAADRRPDDRRTADDRRPRYGREEQLQDRHGDIRKPRREPAEPRQHRRSASFGSRQIVGRRRQRSSSSCASSQSNARKLRPRKRSRPAGNFADRLPFAASAKASVASPGVQASPGEGKTAPVTPAVGDSPATSPAGDAANKAKKIAAKIDFGNLAELQKKLDGDRNQMQLWVITSKRENEEKERWNEKCEQLEHQYYKPELGTPCGPENRLLLEEALGKGVFSTVFRAQDTGHQGKTYAIKFIRSDPMCRRATEKEIKLMRMLRNQASSLDPEGAQCLLSLTGIETFDQDGHLAVVLQLMKGDMRRALRKYGPGKGLPISLVHIFARDIFLALRALRTVNVIHADLKPDNLLISLSGKSAKLSDFGSAMDASQAEQVRTDYLQPRYYRAPEVIMGQTYTTQIDMWSAGATVYELATDCILFRGESNTGMIHAMLKLCGPFPKNQVALGKFASKHFNASHDLVIKDTTDGAVVSTFPMSTFAKPSRTVLQLLEEAAAKHSEAATGISVETKASLRQLADLVMQCCKFDPGQRCQPTQALQHAFVKKVYTGSGEVENTLASNADAAKSFASGIHEETHEKAASVSVSTKDVVPAPEKVEATEKAEEPASKDEIVEVVQPSLPSVEAGPATPAPEQAPRAKEPEKARLLMLNPENTLKFRGNRASLYVTNNSKARWVAFKFKTTNPELYLVKPTSGVLGRGERHELQLQLQSKNGRAINTTHRFLVQAMEVDSGGPVPREKWSKVPKGGIQEHTLGAELQQEVVGKTSSASLSVKLKQSR